MKKTALIIGGNGIIGRNLALHLETTQQWDVIVSSHSPLRYQIRGKFVQMDLNNPDSLKENEAKLKSVTHIFYAAYVEKKSLTEQVAANMALLQNLMNDAEELLPNFVHITFIQGGKAYGAHLGMYRTPAKETDLRCFPPNFYYDQEDYLREKSKGRNWNWTAIRPDMVIGYTVNNPMNLGNLIAVYACLCKELNVPFRFPGSPKAYEVLVNVTGTEVLSKSMEWVATADNTRNEIFNITNGDIFRWKDAWQRFAEFFEIPYAEPQKFPLTDYMADKAALWETMVKKYGLQQHTLDQLVQWAFGDFIFGTECDAFFDVNKARRYGFQEMYLDSIEQMIAYFQTLKDNKIIP
ncbi:SDR family oxidoreductase [Sphingobacterium sp. DR205]|uniref:SDR family oxidoreductase n=1 Tax=Sphingobacterium sp. DR205 TaxID=2713573 RepID=UPI0013E4CCD4|nr:SDR family oxidoreductase [Sphingobacterium sp. DR205]QIH34739.1 SDR family oxidoreductase [Sphingobacterium sp. DR205]